MAHLRNVIHMDVYGMFLFGNFHCMKVYAILLVHDNKNNRKLEIQN